MPRRPAHAADPIRIGELNSYGRFAAFTVPYRQGFQLALEEINAAGGVNGRKLEVISRDDGGTTGDAVRVAEELVTREKVSFIFGTFLSNVGLAVGDFANQRKVLFIAAEPLTDALTMNKGNRYTFRLRANTWMQVGMLVDAVKQTGARRWAIVAPNYEYGQSSAENFKALAAKAIPGFEVVAEQFPALGKIDAGATVAAIEQAKPDAIFNVLFGGDLAQFVREGATRGLFEGRTVASLLTGEPEWMLPLRDEVPQGWIVTGYPWEQIEDAPHKAFVAAYRAKFDDTPRLGLAARLPAHVHDPRHAGEGRFDRHRGHDRRARGPGNGHGRRPGEHARDRQPGNDGRLGRQADPQGRQGRDGGLDLLQRRRLHARRGNRQGRPPGLIREPARRRHDRHA